MAKTNLTHTCGHEGVVHGSNRRDADWRAAKAAKGPCWDCQCKVEQAAATEAAEVAGLPALTGTPKQIAYGMVKRQGALFCFDLAAADLRKLTASTPDLLAVTRQSIDDAIDLLRDERLALTAAKDWIEMQSIDSDSLYIEMTRRNLVVA